MKRNSGKVSLLISLGLHVILMLLISPFLLKQFHEPYDDLSLVILRIGNAERLQRRSLRQHKTAQQTRSFDSGSPTQTRAAPKHSPEMNPPKALLYDDVAPEIVTHTDIPQTEVYTLPNASLGEDGDLSGPVVDPIQRGAGGTVQGPGRGGSGTGVGSGMGSRLSRITGADDLGSIKLDEGIEGLGIFDTDLKPGHGLIGQVYVFGRPIYMMPHFEGFNSLYTFATSKLDIRVRNFTEGFPTPQKQNILENFAIRFRGQLAVTRPGTYTFEILSDDGSKLYIDGLLVIDNDGVHQPQTRRAHIPLSVGFHPVEIHYFQGPRFKIALQWFYTPPGGKRQVVPPEVIFQPGKHDVQEELRKLSQWMNKKHK